MLYRVCLSTWIMRMYKRLPVKWNLKGVTSHPDLYVLSPLFLWSFSVSPFPMQNTPPLLYIFLKWQFEVVRSEISPMIVSYAYQTSWFGYHSFFKKAVFNLLTKSVWKEAVSCNIFFFVLAYAVAEHILKALCNLVY